MSKVKIEGNASGTGTLTIAAPNTNSDYSVTLPEVTGGEFVVTDSSGNVLVGKTSSSINTAGHTLFPTGYADHVRDGDVCLRLNRQTSDGEIVNFRKDGSTVGSIGADSGDLYIGTGDTGVRFRDAGDDILPFNTSTGADRDAAVDLGDASSRFKDLYLSGGVYLGGTGSANHLDDYETGTITNIGVKDSPTGNAATGSFSGTYVKIGDMVFCDIFLSNINTSGLTSSNTMYFTGLPFTATQTAYGSVQLDRITFSGFVQAQVGSGAAYGVFRENVSSAQDTSLLVSDVYANGGSDIYFSVAYSVA
jgi:hypothetical protein